jgi:cytochrome c oxidase cbb3-type subunit 3
MFNLSRYLVLLLLLAVSGVLHAADGAELFRRHCAVCHGDHGEGGVGVPLALPDFQRQVSDTFLKRTIRYGRPGRVMPAFSSLSDEEINALVAQVRSFVDVKAPVYEQQHISGNAERGKQLFAQNCARCHGSEGKGGQGTGVTFSRPRDLPVIPPGLNNPGFLRSASDEMIKHTLEQGREGTPMPSFSKQGLSDQQLNDIVAYVRSFQQHPAHPHGTDVAGEPLTLSYESPYGVEETVAAVKRAAVGKNFRLIRVQKLNQGLVEAGKENPKQVIVYFCNFQMLNNALAIDPRVGLFLPCRVTVAERDGKVSVYAINPKRLSYLFNNSELNTMCDDMYNTYVSILEEATL